MHRPGHRLIKVLAWDAAYTGKAATMTEPALKFLSLGQDLTKENEDLLETIHDALNRLTQRRKVHLSMPSTFIEDTLREVLLYRVVAMASGIIVNWNTGNVLCSFLAVRGLFETFAFLWDYDRAITKARETGTLKEFDALTHKRLGATRNPEWIKNNPEWQATNIVTLIDRLSEEYPGPLGGAARKAYDEMSYRCHPNTEGLLYTFADIDLDTKTIRFSDHNENAGWAFRFVFAIAGLIIEAEKLFNKLEEVTPKVSTEIRAREFRKLVEQSDQQEKQFAKFVREEKKALQGNAGGQFNIGTIHANGLGGLQKNPVLAHMWFSLSAAQGNEKAAQSRDMIARNMTPAQIAEAQTFASEWKPLTSEQVAEIDKFWSEYKPKPSDVSWR